MLFADCEPANGPAMYVTIALTCYIVFALSLTHDFRNSSWTASTRSNGLIFKTASRPISSDRASATASDCAVKSMCPYGFFCGRCVRKYSAETSAARSTISNHAMADPYYPATSRLLQAARPCSLRTYSQTSEPGTVYAQFRFEYCHPS